MRPTERDEELIHQVPLLLDRVDQHHPHWRESYFFDIHAPDGEGRAGEGDVVFFTMARYPARQHMDSLQMGRVGGEQLIGLHDRADDGDPHTTEMPGARVEIVDPWKEVRIWADPDTSVVGLDLTFRARTLPYGLRRGTMRAGDDVVWDQSHILQSGTYTGTYSVGGTTHEVDGWIGQRDHSWGVRDHGRCPLWLWFQIQLDDGFLGVWHWELPNGATVYTDGCWAGVVGFHHDVAWDATYGTHGEAVSGLSGTCRFDLAGGRSITVEAEGTFARPYEPFQRGGLNLMRVHTDDGRSGTAIYEVTGARHHHFFPDTEVSGTLPG